MGVPVQKQTGIANSACTRGKGNVVMEEGVLTEVNQPLDDGANREADLGSSGEVRLKAGPRAVNGCAKRPLAPGEVERKSGGDRAEDEDEDGHVRVRLHHAAVADDGANEAIAQNRQHMH